MQKKRISVIIPAKNESAAVGETIASLKRAGQPSVEIIVVDGGSSDDTGKIAEAAGIDHLLTPEKTGRANQMNDGAAIAGADSEWLLFLHADTILPESGLGALLNLPDSVVGGAFQRRFESNSKLLAVTAWISDFRSKKGVFLGDQAIFVRPAVFKKLSGFDAGFKICEDIDFSKRMSQLGPTALIPGPAISSARRFENKGETPLKRSWKDFVITLKFLRNPDSFRNDNH